MKNIIISILVTWIFFKECTVSVPSPLFVVPAFFILVLAIVTGIEDLVRKEWFY